MFLRIVFRFPLRASNILKSIIVLIEIQSCISAELMSHLPNRRFYIPVDDKPTGLSPIPEHMDFQKVAEVYINKEKYRVLKPSVHVVRDYFADTMMRRDTNNSPKPTERVFIDNNGLRHFWNIFSEKPSQSLRRVIPGKQADTIETVEDVEDKKQEEEESSDEDVETTTKDRPKRKGPLRYSKRKKTIPKKIALRGGKKKTKLGKSNNGNDDIERTLVKTTFFCPFFGVLTMNSYLDDNLLHDHRDSIQSLAAKVDLDPEKNEVEKDNEDKKNDKKDKKEIKEDKKHGKKKDGDDKKNNKVEKKKDKKDKNKDKDKKKKKKKQRKKRRSI